MKTGKGAEAFREVFLGTILAAFVSANAVLLIVYGLMGVHGLPLLTGGFLISCEIAILALSLRWVKPQLADYLFFAFVLCAIISFVINGRTADTKQIALFVVSLAAYPAARCAQFSRPRVHQAFIHVSGAVVAVGTILTAYALFAQWGDSRYVRPVVLGVNDAASTFFLMVCGLFIIAVVAAGLNWRRSIFLSAFVFFPIAVFSAAYVRATFIAIIAALGLSLILSGAEQRKYLASLIGVILIAIAVGQAPSYLSTKPAAAYPGRERVQSLLIIPVTSKTSAPSCSEGIDMTNSIAMRRALLADAISILPNSGLFGIGLGAFSRITCLSMEVHNSYMQAFVELGWLGGLSLVLAVAAAMFSLLTSFRSEPGAHFALCGLAYVGTLSMAHGILSEDRVLFMLLGIAAGCAELHTRKTQTR